MWYIFVQQKNLAEIRPRRFMVGPARKNPASATSRRRKTVGDRGGVTLAVCHGGGDVEEHIAPLRRAGRFTLACFPPPAALDRVSPSAFDGVLWELSSAHQPDPRRVAAMSRVIPVVSYSTRSERQIAALSKQIGFASHLTVPLSPEGIERRIRLRARTDFAARLLQGQAALRARLCRRSTLIDVMRSVNQALEPRKVADALLAHAQSWLVAPAWAVAAVQNGSVALIAERGPTEGCAQAILEVARCVVDRGEELLTSDLRGDRRLEADMTATVVALPLRCLGRTIGALIAFDPAPSRQEPRLSPGVLTSLHMLLEPSGVALGSALRLQRAEALSVTDDLTGLYNSRYLNQVLRRETKRASRSGRPLCMLFIDLDNFKVVNDLHGHLCGSHTLVEAAGVIRGSARETDVVARFGGDEFAVVLPDTGSEGAEAVGERVRERIAAFRFLTDKGLDVRLTASVGVAALPDVAASAEELVKAADIAMYEVKNSGKNGVHVATEALLEVAREPLQRA
jgi:diguanylate cyclase (GGDEF)-like protein